jgi:hypothetical protein
MYRLAAGSETAGVSDEHGFYSVESVPADEQTAGGPAGS